MSKRVAGPKSTPSLLSDLPPELIERVATYLPAAELLAMSRTGVVTRAACATSIAELLRTGPALHLGGFAPTEQLVLLSRAELILERPIRGELALNDGIGPELQSIAQSGRCRDARPSFVQRLVQRFRTPSWLAEHAELISALVLARWADRADDGALACYSTQLAAAWQSLRAAATGGDGLRIKMLTLRYDHASADALQWAYAEMAEMVTLSTLEGDDKNAEVFSASSSAPCDRYRQHAVEAGAVEAVAAVLRAYSQMESVQILGGVVLSHICGRRGAQDSRAQRVLRKQRAVEAGAVETLVAALRAYPQVQTVQIASCWALTHICAGEDGAVETRRRRAAEAGALEVVMAALRTYPQVVEVQTPGLSMLSHICYAAEIVRQRAVETGALGAVVAGMTAHPQLRARGECQRAGCHALMSLCDGGTGNAADDRRQQAVEADALEAVVAAMCTHPEQEVQHEGCWALHAICWVPDDEARREQHGGRMQRAAEACALEAVAAAVLAHEQLGYIGRPTLAKICSGEDDAAGLRTQRAAELLSA